MRFVRAVFVGAGIWGVIVLLPFYGLVDVTGRQYAAPTEYPQFFYGFSSVALAWQVAFLIIGSNPARYRALMISSVIEKLAYVITLAVLYFGGRVPAVDAQALWPDLLPGVLFIAAFVVTQPAKS